MRATASTLVLSGNVLRRRYRCLCNDSELSLTDAQLLTCAYLVSGLFCNVHRVAKASELPDTFGDPVLARKRISRLGEALQPFGVEIFNKYGGYYRLPISRRNITLHESFWQAQPLLAMPEATAALKEAYERFQHFKNIRTNHSRNREEPCTTTTTSMATSTTQT